MCTYIYSDNTVFCRKCIHEKIRNRNLHPKKRCTTDVSEQQTGRGISTNFFLFQINSKENRLTMGVMEQLSVDSLFGDVQRMDKRQVSVGSDCFVTET